MQQFNEKKIPAQEEMDYLKSFSQLIEVIYDPFLTWRNFLKGDFADHRRIWYNIVQLHVELIPFIHGNVLNDWHHDCDL